MVTAGGRAGSTRVVAMTGQRGDDGLGSGGWGGVACEPECRTEIVKWGGGVDGCWHCRDLGDGGTKLVEDTAVMITGNGQSA